GFARVERGAVVRPGGGRAGSHHERSDRERCERRTRRPRPGRTGDSPLDRAGPGGRSATAPRGGVEWSAGTRRDVLLRSGRWRSWPAPHVDGFVPDLVDGERIAPAELRGGRV